jgi:hypothetical protein
MARAEIKAASAARAKAGELTPAQRERAAGRADRAGGPEARSGIMEHAGGVITTDKFVWRSAAAVLRRCAAAVGQ